MNCQIPLEGKLLGCAKPPRALNTHVQGYTPDLLIKVMQSRTVCNIFPQRLHVGIQLALTKDKITELLLAGVYWIEVIIKRNVIQAPNVFIHMLELLNETLHRLANESVDEDVLAFAVLPENALAAPCFLVVLLPLKITSIKGTLNWCVVVVGEGFSPEPVATHRAPNIPNLYARKPRRTCPSRQR